MGKKNDYSPWGGMRGKKLSDIEVTILHQYSRGATLHEIADKLHRSVDSIQSHLRNTRYKLAVHSMVEAIYKACRLKIIRMH